MAFALVSVAAFLAMMMFGLTGRSGSFAQVGEILIFGTVLITPTIFVGLAAPRRWLNVSSETMLPLTRCQLVREVGAAMARDHAALWFWQVLAAFLIVELGEATESSSGRYVVGYVELAGRLLMLGEMLIVLGLMQVLAFGLIVWALRFRSGIASLLILFPAAAAAVLPLMLMRNAFDLAGTVGLVVFPVSLGLLGLLLTMNAYRWWCRADLD